MQDKIYIEEQIQKEDKLKAARDSVQLDLIRGLEPSIYLAGASNDNILKHDLSGVIDRAMKFNDMFINTLKRQASLDGVSVSVAEYGKSKDNMYRLDDDSIEALSNFLKETGYVDLIQGND